MSVNLTTTAQELNQLGYLSVRAMNACLNGGYLNLGQILNATSADLLKTRNCGRKSALEILSLKELFSQKQLECSNQDLSQEKTSNPFGDDYEELERALQEVISQSQDQNTINIEGLIVKAFGSNKSLLLSLSLIDSNLLDRIQFSTFAENEALRVLILTVLRTLAGRDNLSPGTIASLNANLQLLSENIEDIRRKDKFNHLPAFLREKGNFLCRRKFNKLSNRIKNRLSKYDNIDVLYDLMYGKSVLDKRDIDGLGRKSFEEFNAYLEDCRVIVTSILEESDDAIEYSEKEAATRLIKQRFPFLLSKECEYVATSSTDDESLPGLYLAYKYITRDESTSAIIHRDIYALNEDGIGYSLTEIAQKVGLTRERVRHISTKKVNFPASISRFCTKAVQPFVEDVYPPYHPLFNEISKDYGFSVKTIIGLICSINGKYTVVEIEGLTEPYLVNRHLLTNVRLKMVIADINRKIGLQRTTNLNIDLKQALTEGRNRNLFHKNIAKLSIILVDLFKQSSDVVVVNDITIQIKPNAIDKVKAIEGILSEIGRATDAQTLWNCYKDCYPDYPIKTLVSFRSYIARSQNILPRGKTGTYVLRTWPNAFAGTITDFIVHILEAFEEPLSIEDIEDFAKAEFPTTNRKSLASLISINDEGRFVVFSDDRIGLSSADYGSLGLKIKRIQKRHSYIERFKDLQEFISSHKRFPVSSTNEEEDSLSRWLSNVQGGRIAAPKEFIEQFNDYLSSLSSLPRTGDEIRFKRVCDSVKVIVAKTFQMPDRIANPTEYNWFKKNLARYETFGDNRKRFFENLLEFLRDYGFCF